MRRRRREGERWRVSRLTQPHETPGFLSQKKGRKISRFLCLGPESSRWKLNDLNFYFYCTSPKLDVSSSFTSQRLGVALPTLNSACFKLPPQAQRKTIPDASSSSASICDVYSLQEKKCCPPFSLDAFSVKRTQNWASFYPKNSSPFPIHSSNTTPIEACPLKSSTPGRQTREAVFRNAAIAASPPKSREKEREFRLHIFSSFLSPSPRPP